MNVAFHSLGRIGIGLSLTTVVAIALTSIPPLFPFVAPAGDPFFMSQPLPALEQSLKIAAATFAGAYVARVPFVVAAVVYCTGTAVYSFYVLTAIAAPIEAVSIFEVAARNSIGTGVGLIAAAAGADLGHRLSNARPRTNQAPL